MLINFKEYFRDKAASVIKKAAKDKFILPFNTRNDITTAIKNSAINNNLLLPSSSLEKILTPRQIDCGKLLMQGMNIKEIASFLNLSTRTVEYYINNIKIKLDCKNRTELILQLSKLFS